MFVLLYIMKSIKNKINNSSKNRCWVLDSKKVSFNIAIHISSYCFFISHELCKNMLINKVYEI